MNAIFQRGETAIWYLIGSPESRQQGAIVACLGVLTVVLMLGRLAHVMQMKRKGSLYAILGGVLSLAVLVGLSYGIHTIVSPMVGFPRSYPGTVGTAIVISFALVVPILCLIQRAEVLSAGLAWGMALMAAVCVVVIARVGFGVVTSGSVKAQETIERSTEMEAFLEQQ